MSENNIQSTDQNAADNILYNDILSLDDIQRLQDLFSDATGVASVIIQANGTPITTPSNFCRLCSELICKKEKANSICCKSETYADIFNASLSVVKQCEGCGLWHAGANIVVDGQHIATWLIGQVRNENPDVKRIHQFVNEIGANRDEFMAAFLEVPVMSAVQFNKVSKMLFAFASELSQKAYNNLQLNRQAAEREATIVKLHESEVRFHALFEGAPDAIILADPVTGKILDANQSASLLLGREREAIKDLFQHQLHPVVSEDYSKETFNQHIAELELNGSAHPIESTIIRSNSDLVPVEVMAQLVSVNNEKLIMGTFRDITERKKAESRLKESEEKYRILFMDSPDSYLIITDGIITDCNKATERMMLGNRTQIVGFSPDKLSPEFQPDGQKSDELAKTKIQEALLKGTNTFEWLHVKFDGTALFVEVSIASMLLDGKSVLFTTWRDITERKNAENALKESKGQYYKDLILLNSILESPIDIIIFALDTTYCYTKFTAFHQETMRKIWGVDIQVGMNMLEVISNPADRQKAKNNFDRVLCGENFVVTEEYGDNTLSRTFYENYYSTVKDSTGNIAGISVFVIDITQRKQAEGIIKLAEQSYFDIFNSVSEAIYIQDKTGAFIDVNKGAEIMYGCERKYLIGKTPDLVAAPGLNNLEAIQQLSQQVFETGIPARFDFWAVRKNGEVFPKDLILNKGMYFGQEVLLATARDITEKKQAEETLRKSEEKYRALVNNAFEGIIIIDFEGKVLFANQSLIKTFEYETLDEILGKNVFDYIAPESIPQAIEDLTNVVQGIKIKVAIYGGITSSGKRVWFESIGKVIEYEGTNADIISVRDITEKKHAEQALRQSEEKYRHIAENTSDGILALNAANHIEYVSPSYLKQLGFSESEIIGKDSGDVFQDIHPHDREDLFARIFKAIEEHKSELIYTFRVKHKKGHFIWREDNARFHYDSEGNYDGSYVICRDITDRKIAEEKLIENENKFRAITETANDAIIVTNDKGLVVFVNPKAIEIFGYLESEFLEKPFDLIMPQRYRGNHNENFKTFVESGISFFMGKTREFSAIRKDGSEFPMEISLSNWETSAGLYVAANIRDITGRKRSEQIKKIQYRIINAVLEARDLDELMSIVQEELNTLIDASNFYVAIYNEKTGMLSAPYVRDEGEKNTEWPAAKSLTGLVIRKNKALLLSRKDIDELYKTGEVELIGTPSACWLGVPLHTGAKTTGAFVVQSYTNVNAYSESDMEMLGFVSYQISMAMQRKNDEQQISLFGKSIEQSPVSILITDLEGKIKYVNPKFSEVTGYSLEEVAILDTNILKSGIQSTAVYTQLWETINSGSQWFGELQNQKKNGDIYWETVSISPINNSEGKVTHFVVVKEDITEKKKMENDLIAEKERAEESDRLKSAFLANMSHEIRTPMNGILGFAELLKMPGLSGEQQQEFIRIIKKSGDRMLNIINDIVDISKIESGQMKVLLSNTHINEQMAYIYDFFLPETDSKGLQLYVKNGLPDDECIVDTDQEKIYAILTNLVKNAIKYTNDGSIEFGYTLVNTNIVASEVRHDLPLQPQYLQFYVKDTGIGIPFDRQKAIFDRFVQADIADTRAYQGAGLGLSITKAFVEMLGGEIWVESQLFNGSVFYFTIPYLREADVKTIREKEFGAVDDTKKETKLKILITEDDETSVFFLEIALKDITSKVFRARTGIEAVEICRNHPDVDLILMDIKMPEMDGYEATELIRQFNQDVVIIAQTAFGLTGDREKALKAGCNDYLPKPLSKKELMNIINCYF